MMRLDLLGWHSRRWRRVDHVLLSVLVLFLLSLEGSGAENETWTTTSPAQDTSVTSTSLTSTSLTTEAETVTSTSTLVDRTMTTTLLTTAVSNTTTAVYWMRVSVNVTENTTQHNESHVAAWLRSRFQQHLNECRSTPTAEPPNTLNHSANLDNKTTSSLFQNIEVTCDEKTAIRRTECSVVLQLSQPTSSNCIACIINTEQVNCSIQGQVSADHVKRLVCWSCRSSDAAPPAGSSEKCNSSLSFDCVCNTTATVRISGFISDYMHHSWGFQTQMNCSCIYGSGASSSATGSGASSSATGSGASSSATGSGASSSATGSGASTSSATGSGASSSATGSGASSSATGSGASSSATGSGASSSATGSGASTSSATGSGASTSSATGSGASSSAPDSVTSTSSATDSVTSTSSAPGSGTSTSSVPDSVTSTSSAPDSVTSTSSAADSVTSTSSAPDSVTSTSSAPDSGTSTSSAADSVTSTSSAPDSVTSTSSVPDSVTSTSSAPDSVTSTSSAADSGTSTSSAPDSVTSTSSVPDSVTSTSSAPDSVTSTSSAPDSVTSTSSAPGSGTSTSSVPDSVTSTSSAPDSVTSTSSAADSVTSTSSAADSVTSTSSAPDSVTSTSSAPDSGTSTSSAADSGTSTSSAPDSVTSTSSAADSVTSTSSVPDSGTSTSSAPDSVTSTSSAADSVTSTSSAPDSVTSTSSAPDSGTSTSSAADSGTSTSSAPDSVTSTSSAPDSVTSTSSAPDSGTSTSSVPDSVTSTSSAASPGASKSSAPGPEALASYVTSPEASTSTAAGPGASTSSATSPGASTSSAASAGASTSSAASPGVSTSSGASPGASTSSAASPGASTSFATRPGASTSSAASSGASTSSATSPGASTSTAASPGASTSSAASPGVSTSSAASPGASTSSAASPGASTSSATRPGASTSSATGTGTSPSSAAARVNCVSPPNCSTTSPAAQYYNMKIRVNETDHQTKTNESSITVWLKNLFEQRLGECRSDLSATPASAANVSGSSARLIQNIQVLCNNKTEIRYTECTVLLCLNQTTNPCCIECIITAVQINSSIQGHVLEIKEEDVTGLLNLSKNISATDPSQVQRVVSSLEWFLSVPKVDLSLANTSLNIINNLLNTSAQIPQSTSNRIINIMDTLGLRMDVQNQNLTIFSPSLILAVVAVNGTRFQNTSFNMSSSNVQMNVGSSSYSSLYPTVLPLQGSIVLPGSLMDRLTEKSQASRVQFNFYQESTLFQDQALDPNKAQLISGVLGCSVMNLSISNLTDNVVITLRHTQSVSGDVTVSCVFWNFSLNSGAGGWSSEGCSVLNSAVNETVCGCKHLTNFCTLRCIGSNVACPPANEEQEAEHLADLVKNPAALTAAEVNKIVSQLENLLRGNNISTALANTSINIVSNLMNASPEALKSTAARMVGIVDAVGLKLVVKNKRVNISSPSVNLKVQMVNETQEISFSSDNQQSVSTDLSPRGSVVLPLSLMSFLDQQQQQESRVLFNFYSKSSLFQDRALDSGEAQLISGVLGSSVANRSISNLTENVVIRLGNTLPVPAGNSVSCVFWKSNLNSGSGGWSSEGCSVLNRTESETLCGCNHLTSFGVLLVKSPPSIVLTYITYVGCGVSVIFLCITLLTYLAFEKLHSDIPSKILIQFCSALLLLDVVFLIDLTLAHELHTAGLCITTALFLHYFTLATFTWMALQAFYMYLTIIKVFNTHYSHFMIKLGFVGWGIPLTVVITVLAINKDIYGLVSYGKFEDGSTDYFCWFRSDAAFYSTVMAYFCGTYLLTLSMFVVVMVLLCRIRSQSPHYSQQRTLTQDFRSVTALLVFLGLTWGFGFFAWGPLNVPFMYLFTICNSFQGFLIFVFYCAAKGKVRSQWRIYLRCAKYRLERSSAVFRRIIIKPSSGTKTLFSPSKTPNSSTEGSGHNISLPTRSEFAEISNTVEPSLDSVAVSTESRDATTYSYL